MAKKEVRKQQRVNKPQPVKKVEIKEKHKFQMPSNWKWLPVVYAILFAIYAFYMLVAKNSDYLYEAQEFSLFVEDHSFFDMMCVKPGGFITWIGCFLTQFFYYPWLGSLILIVIWLAIYFLTVKAFKLYGLWSCLALLPIGLLLSSETIIGYWLYYLKVFGFWFSQSAGLLLAMVAICIAEILKEKNKWAHVAWIIIWCVGGYVATGWIGLLSTLVMGLMGITTNFKKTLLPLITSFAGIIVVPIISYQFCTKMRIEDAWNVGFPLFQTDAYTSTFPSIPYYALIVVLILLSVISFKSYKEVIEKNAKSAILLYLLQVVCIVAVIAWEDYANDDDYNYHAELRIYRDADEYNWQAILDECAQSEVNPTREMILFRNIALIYQGNIGDRMFHYNNYSQKPIQRDSLAVRMAQTNASLTYIFYGKMNFATRWCMENAVEYGFSPDRYKILTRCALVSGEFKLAKKYIDILKKTMFHKEWAMHYEPMLKDHSLVEKAPEFKNILEYYNHFRSMLDSDEGLVELYLLNYYSNTMNKDSKLLQETTLVYSLIDKDIQKFWPRFFLYAHLHQNETMPIHYQEAAYLYGNLEHQVDISNMPFDQARVIQRYAQFDQLTKSYLQQGLSSEQIGEETKATFGDTFWWFYFFCRGLQSY